ncbi:MULTISPECIES: hypothetical protein [unclassified Neisseria]|uniref:hypothetical protein n=1 Tax=unclassified Neisseria TaxID=2623750 RepID=UPI00107281C5|nr:MULTISPECIES: hypothetical protein [unclassified Neisseria]MBF0804853.1 hypothetical protein [Neisseria sp. 19428wB4_WF04]TFU39446.1 hypothetical protein E4T99_11095 [Neisseria sp. WF04]
MKRPGKVGIFYPGRDLCKIHSGRLKPYCDALSDGLKPVKHRYPNRDLIFLSIGGEALKPFRARF